MNEESLQATNASINIFQGDELNITRAFLQQLGSNGVTNLQVLAAFFDSVPPQQLNILESFVSAVVIKAAQTTMHSSEFESI